MLWYHGGLKLKRLYVMQCSIIRIIIQMRCRLKTDGLLPDLATDSSTLFVLKFKYRTSISKFILVKLIWPYYDVLWRHIWWRNWTMHVRYVFDFDFTTNHSNIKKRKFWVQNIMIRVILAPNDVLTPFDLRAQIFRVNVE